MLLQVDWNEKAGQKDAMGINLMCGELCLQYKACSLNDLHSYRWNNMKPEVCFVVGTGLAWPCGVVGGLDR